MFIFDKDYKNLEQVAEFYPQFAEVYRELEDAGRYPYDDFFEGRIDGLNGSQHEKTGIYLLQKMHDIREMESRVEAFRAKGARPLGEVIETNEVRRGTLAHFGFYMGGTGYREYADARVTVDDRGYVKYKLPRQRAWRLSSGHYMCPEKFLFLES